MSEQDNLNRLDGHEERFNDLCALAPSGNLSAEEAWELDEHLKTCPQCREAYEEYMVLAKEGLPSLAVHYVGVSPSTEGVSEELVEATRRGLSARLAVANPMANTFASVPRSEKIGSRVLESAPRRLLALAAAVLLAVGLSAGSYRLGQRKSVVSAPPRPVADARIAILTSEKIAADYLVAMQTKQLDQLRDDGQQRARELAKLDVQLKAVEGALCHAAEERSAVDAHLQQQRDEFGEQIRKKEEAYDQVLTELARLRSEREKTLLKMTSLEQEVSTLVAEKGEQQHRMKDQEEYLSADRDIREIMGARQLYIADVFDVSSDSRTRKPYGRVFYTRGKSLIFYAFDLDRQGGRQERQHLPSVGQE